MMGPASTLWPEGSTGAVRPRGQDGREVLISVRGLRVHYPAAGGLTAARKAPVRAVDGLDLDVRRGRTVGVVGESGCGKTTLGRAMVALVRPTAGTIEINGRAIDHRSGRHRRAVQMIFQDPFGAMNPGMRVTDVIAEPMRIHRVADADDIRTRVAELLDLVGLPPGSGEAPSPRVQRRPAPADRHRPRPGGRTGGDRLRRAGVVPGRLRAGPGGEPAGRPAGPHRHGARLHRPRPGRGAPHLPRGGGHVPGRDRRAGRTATGCTPSPSIPTRRRFWRRSPSRSRPVLPPGTGPGWSATFPARPILPRAVGSTPAVRWPSRACARPSPRRWRRPRPAGGCPVTW